MKLETNNGEKNKRIHKSVKMKQHSHKQQVKDKIIKEITVSWGE